MMSKLMNVWFLRMLSVYLSLICFLEQARTFERYVLKKLFSQRKFLCVDVSFDGFTNLALGKLSFNIDFD